MCCKGFWKRSIAFTLAITCGILLTDAFQKVFGPEICYGTSVSADFKNDFPAEPVGKSLNSGGYDTTKVKIIAKPVTAYCPVSEGNGFRPKRGKAVVYVTFLANGKVGEVFTPIHSKDKLTEEASIIAKNIKFRPTQRNGVPVSVVEPVEFDF